MQQESFEKFYYNKVGLGEGCGCAERVIDVYEFNRLSGGHTRREQRFSLNIGARLGKIATRLRAVLKF